MSDSQLAMFEDITPKADGPRTRLARILSDHFSRGGSIPDAIALIEKEELATSHKTNKQAANNARGSRLSPDWSPSNSEIEFAVGRGMTVAQVSAEAEKFRNYWVAKAGANATKRDWSATWRNWIITALEKANGFDGQRRYGVATSTFTGRPRTGSDTVLAAMGRVAQQLDQRFGAALDQRRQIPDASDFASDSPTRSETT